MIDLNAPQPDYAADAMKWRPNLATAMIYRWEIADERERYRIDRQIERQWEELRAGQNTLFNFD